MTGGGEQGHPPTQHPPRYSAADRWPESGFSPVAHICRRSFAPRRKESNSMSRLNGYTRTLTALGMAVVLGLWVSAALAATTGKLTGVVRERGSNSPLPGVTVTVDDTRLGAIADDQGRYTILNVPAGVHTVRGRIVGYADYVATNVEVRPDFTTEVNLVM